jgi:5'-nucleotidase
LGSKVASQGWRPGSYFGVEPHHAPNGRRFLWIKGGVQAVDSGPGTDVRANLEDYIAITPMRADLTAHDRLADLEARLG